MSSLPRSPSPLHLSVSFLFHGAVPNHLHPVFLYSPLTRTLQLSPPSLTVCGPDFHLCFLSSFCPSELFPEIAYKTFKIPTSYLLNASYCISSPGRIPALTTSTRVQICELNSNCSESIDNLSPSPLLSLGTVHTHHSHHSIANPLTCTRGELKMEETHTDVRRTCR